MDSQLIQQIGQIFTDSQKIVVFTGAGISTSCGIPDFRSPNGIYALVEKEFNLPYPEAIFDISYFNREPEPFFQLTQHLLKVTTNPSISHRFLAWLESEGKLELIITQNIDMLHTRAGNNNVLECHGTYKTATCTGCRKKFELAWIEQDLASGRPPRCPDCNAIIKPDIVFFGEQLPHHFYTVYESPPEADLVLIMGTSLTVQPAASLALKITQNTTSILVNMQPTNYDAQFTHVIPETTDTFSQSIWNVMKGEK